MEVYGQRLSLAKVSAVARGAEHVSLAEAARARIEASRRVIEQIIAENRTVYGVNTGFGKLSDVRIDPSQIRALQLNLVRSHSCGLGDPLSIEEARAMLLLRANVLALGYSGCRPIVVETLIEMLNHGVTPVIPEKGSVGASGDLAPLAHLALTAIGEGEAYFEQKRMPSADALVRAGIAPLQLEAKEGIEVTDPTEVVARLSFQRFFRFYTRLSGMMASALAPTGAISPNPTMGKVTFHMDSHAFLIRPRQTLVANADCYCTHKQ